MSKQTEALKLALEALSPWAGKDANHTEQYAAYHAIREALVDSALERMAENARELGLNYEPAQKQEPVCDKDPLGCWSIRCQLGKMCKNTPPASKPWVGLTDEEIHKMTVLMGINPEWKAEMEIVRSVVRNLEAKLREKNA